MEAFHRAQTNRSLRTIRTELDFLLDAQVLTASMVSKITALLPTPPDSSAINSTTAGNPTPAPTPTPTLTSPTPSVYNEKHYQPTPQPVPSPTPPVYSPTPQGPQAIATASAIYAYAAAESGDLDMQPGDRIAVLEWTNADWARGRSERTGAEGIFPRSYTKVLENEKAPFQANIPYYQQQAQPSNYGNMPLNVAYGQQPPHEQQQQPPPEEPNKMQSGGKKFGKKLGNAAIFGAGASLGSNIVNGIL